MSVLIVTSVGDIVVDLHADRCPLTVKNFLKLCRMKYYNGCLFHKVEKDFMAQTGDRTGTGTGGDSVYKFLYGEQARFFDDEIHPDLKHSKTGTVAMATAGKNRNASQFYFTLRDELDYLDGAHTVFGIVEEKEGLDTLAKINEAYVDDKGRPFKDIRIKHTYILDDPFDDPPQLSEFIPEKSPEGKPNDEIAEERLEDTWVPMDETLGAQELEEVIRAKEAHTNAAILESVGDIPDAEIKPPENVLFVCKLNPVTQDDDLFTIFSRFGTVTSADIIRDYKTGDSLCYAFIEFEDKDACERAYFKMDNTLIDDRRIHVDFSQSVSKLWNQYRHGKRNNAKGGCFKCGAPDHIARDCHEGSDSKQDGPKYVLKNDDIQHGGDDRNRYDMLFDEDNLKDEKENEGQEETKMRKADNRRTNDLPSKDHDKKYSERRRYDDEKKYSDRHRYHDEKKHSDRHRYDDEKNVRNSREHSRRERSRSHDKCQDEKSSEKRSRDVERDTEHPDHKRSSGRNRHGKDGGDYKRASETDRHNRGRQSRDRDDKVDRERRHRDERR
ncbi:peptidyl-prolyl cis-trans isomerase CYP59 [Iris pallida]|uniref:Peptidyl-prolyl cis-trans isomerase n=1 Tax=Iris pallida TaxID=29817 RepID=A0AAX6F3D7_IRIPA|nr:peptidyl-prolyl cis-trans isomerase CYP59 [Iris pallida]